MTDYKMGWKAAMARAITLAVQLGSDNDTRLRRALLNAMDECPDINERDDVAALRFRLKVEERANETMQVLLNEAKAGAK